MSCLKAREEALNRHFGKERNPQLPARSRTLGIRTYSTNNKQATLVHQDTDLDITMAKKRCLDDVLGVECKEDTARVILCKEAGGIPAELWAKALEYLHLDDVLACTATSKFFLKDVSKQIKCLYISSGKSMDILPASIERFQSVENIQVQIIQEIADGPHLYMLMLLQCSAWYHFSRGCQNYASLESTHSLEIAT